MAYVLMQMFRWLGLQGTELTTAQCATFRLKLFTIGALIRITVRKVWIALRSRCPYAGLFCRIHARLAALPLRC
jgi:Transposase DDE domain group 1